MKKAENNIGNLTNSNNNTITQNNIEQQINKIYCFPGTDNRLIEMNMSHELLPHYIVDFKKIEMGNIRCVVNHQRRKLKYYIQLIIKVLLVL